MGSLVLAVLATEETKWVRENRTSCRKTAIPSPEGSIEEMTEQKKLRGGSYPTVEEKEHKALCASSCHSAFVVQIAE
jgi:hypothetical protein